MLGYLRPTFKRSDSKLKQQYRALYCGLCHNLKKQYGYRGVGCLNYEVTFLLLLVLSARDGETAIFHGSCSLTPFVRVPFIDYLDPNVQVASAISMVIASFEVKDNVQDDGLLIWKVLDRLLNRLNQKSIREIAPHEQQIQASLTAFYDLETSGQHPLDEMLQACGDIVESLVHPLLPALDGPVAETVSSLANYAGQWIYLMDACDDFHRDMVAGHYNPLRYDGSCDAVRSRADALQARMDQLISTLPLNGYGELLHYFSRVCIPETSNRILETYERRLMA